MSSGENSKRVPLQMPEREMAKRSRRAFLAMGLAGAAGLGAWKWLATRPEEGGIAWPLRRMLQFNQRVAGTYYEESHLAPGFSAARIQNTRLNGDVGLGDDFNLNKWALSVKLIGGTQRNISLSQIKELPRREQTTQLMCIEGWSVIVEWAGARFSDFTEMYASGSDRARYAGLQTPDEKYYVGIDMASAIHPQTLLCYEMNGAPLTLEHGAPLRLVLPVKYGIKSIKRIGSITYIDDRPSDYWAERSYDWYAAL